MNKKIWYLPLGLSLIIALTAVLFHYPVHIENALTLEPETGFGVRLNTLKTVFEPALGILVYFNRALYPIKELVFVLYWVVLVFIVYTLAKALMQKERKQRNSFLREQLINLPIVIGLWFTFFVIALFIHLPNDRIVNKTENQVLVTTHTHSEFSHDGLISQENLLKWHRRNGFDAFFITDHSNHKQTLEFVNSRRNKELSGEPFVFCGEEFSGSNHLSLLGLKSDFSTKGLPDSAVVAMARAEGAAVLVNHWFDGERKTLEYYRDLGVDGFEIENTATDKRYDREVYRRIKSFCEANDLIMNGGLDFHGYGGVCTLWNAFLIPEWNSLNWYEKEEAILSIIKTRDQSKLKVLLLNDRSYYEMKNLFFRQIATFVNYFRTLRFTQVLSWIFWIFLLIYLRRETGYGQRFSCRKVLPVIGTAGGLFLIILGLAFIFRIQDVEGFTKIYPKYSRILFYAGSPLLIFSLITTYFRVFRDKRDSR